MMATQRWGYFDGTKPRPTAKDPDAPTDDERELLEHWDHEDLIASGKLEVALLLLFVLFMLDLT